MEGKEVRGMKTEEIAAELARLRARLFTLRAQSVTEKVEDNSQFTKVRRDIARLLTERTARHAARNGPKAGMTPEPAAAAPAHAGPKSAPKAGGRKGGATGGKTGAKAGAKRGSKSKQTA
ncbi:MAG: 50S ribosomal protein L29 [Phycisphaerales bacterium]